MTDMDKMIEKVARALVEADGESPDAFHTRADYESGLCLPDHAVPLWRQAPYSKYAKAAVSAYNPDDRLREALEPFADFANLTGASYLPDDHVITLGSGYAARQLTMGDCRRARDARSALSPLPQATR